MTSQPLGRLIFIVASALALGLDQPSLTASKAKPKDEPPPFGVPGQGAPCPGGTCADGLRCVKYSGIAGPSGPALASCEIPCGGMRSSCPPSQKCTTIPDGPRNVCRPIK